MDSSIGVQKQSIKTSNGSGLKLAGDFDATSAYELIYAIKKLPEDTLLKVVAIRAAGELERSRTAAEMKRLASFPILNPNPIVE
jgi:hypothetical protein